MAHDVAKLILSFLGLVYARGAQASRSFGFDYKQKFHDSIRWLQRQPGKQDQRGALPRSDPKRVVEHRTKWFAHRDE